MEATPVTPEIEKASMTVDHTTPERYSHDNLALAPILILN